MTEKECRGYGYVRYNELSEKAAKTAYGRFSWDLVNNKPNDLSHDEVIDRLSKYWFDKNGGTFLGTY